MSRQKLPKSFSTYRCFPFYYSFIRLLGYFYLSHPTFFYSLFTYHSPFSSASRREKRKPRSLLRGGCHYRRPADNENTSLALTGGKYSGWGWLNRKRYRDADDDSPDDWLCPSDYDSRNFRQAIYRARRMKYLEKRLDSNGQPELVLTGPPAAEISRKALAGLVVICLPSRYRRRPRQITAG